MSRDFVVSLHDVSPATAEASRRWLSIIESLGIRASLLVVPGPWRGRDIATSGAFCDWLYQASLRGHEIVQHGWCHAVVRGDVSQRRRALGDLVGRGCQEFWELDEETARTHLVLGREALRQCGFRADGFVAPAWLMSGGTMAALSSLGYRWTTTHLRVVPVAGRSRWMPVLSQRPGSGVSSVVARLTGFAAGMLISLRRPFRIAVHPDDIREAELRHAIVGMCRSAASAGYTARTYGELVGVPVSGRRGEARAVEEL